VTALAPDLDGAPEEVDVARMSEVDQDPHDTQTRAGAPRTRRTYSTVCRRQSTRIRERRRDLVRSESACV
jgi:hypothetical protein